MKLADDVVLQLAINIYDLQIQPFYAMLDITMDISYSSYELSFDATCQIRIGRCVYKFPIFLEIWPRLFKRWITLSTG